MHRELTEGLCGQVTMEDAQYQRSAPEIALALAAPHVRDVFEVRAPPRSTAPPREPEGRPGVLHAWMCQKPRGIFWQWALRASMRPLCAEQSGHYSSCSDRVQLPL
jgi:hypothetical protein